MCPIPVGGTRYPQTRACQLHIRRDTEDGERRGRNFYIMQPEIGHIHTFEYIVRVTPPYEILGKLDDPGAMGI